MSFFQADGLSINFGGIKAVDGVSFDVDQGEVFTIIGPNGAGKTTIFNLVSRIYEPTGGKLIFNSNDITNVPPHRIAALGIARTFQNIELFEHATLLQNLLLARHAHKKSHFWSELLFTPATRRMEVEHREAVEHVIDFLDLQQPEPNHTAPKSQRTDHASHNNRRDRISDKCRGPGDGQPGSQEKTHQS